MFKKILQKIIDYWYPTTIKNNLTISTKTKFDITKLIMALGQAKNIKSISSKINVLNCEVHNMKLVNIEILKKQLKIKGIVFSQNQVELILGDDSFLITKIIKQKINV